MLNNNLVENVSFDVMLSDGEIAQRLPFPPRRFSLRNERLESLEKMWLGDLSEFAGIGRFDNLLPLTINYFHGYSTRIANLLLMSEPSGVSVDAAFDCVIDLTRYGGAVVYTLDGDVQAADATTWYPSESGQHLVIPYTSSSAEDWHPDRVRVWDFPSGGDVGTVHEREFEWNIGGSTGTFGAQISETALGNGAMVVAPRSPRVGNTWGTAKYLEMFTSIVEIANRYTRNSRVLDLNGRPVPVMKMGDTEAEAAFDDDDTDWNVNDDATINRVAEGSVDFMKQEVVRLPDGAMDFKFEAPNVEGVRVSLEQVEALREALKEITGMPSLGGKFQVPSGEALKREFIGLYSESRSMQNSLIQAFMQLGVNVQWEHIFDVWEMEDIERAARAGERLDHFTPAAANSGRAF